MPGELVVVEANQWTAVTHMTPNPLPRSVTADEIIKRPVTSSLSSRLLQIVRITSELIDKEAMANDLHILHCLLPPMADNHYDLRARRHPYRLPDKKNSLFQRNFFIRIFYS